MLGWFLFLGVALQEPGYDEAMAEARRLLEADRIDEALEPLERALAAEPRAPEPLWMMAVAHLKLERYEEGLAYAEALYRTTPGNAQAGLLLANYYERRNEIPKALDVCRFLLEAEPRNPEVLHKQAMLALELEDLELAASSLETILSDFPGDPRSLVPLGSIYFRQGRLPEAEQALLQALHANPSLADAHHYLGAVYSQLGHWEPAERYLDRALELRPGNPASLLEKGLLYERQEKPGLALRFFEEARDADPQNALARFRIAGVERYQKRFDAAEEEYREALALDPDFTDARRELGLLYLEAARYREAEHAFQRVLEDDPDDPEAHHRLAIVYSRMDRFTEAAKHFEKALERKPFESELRLQYGNFLIRRGETEAGREQLERFQELKAAENRVEELSAALRFAPDDVSLETELTNRLLQLGRSDEALERAQMFLTRDPTLPAHYLLVARAYLALGRREEAGSALEQGLELAPDNDSLRSLLSEVRSGSEPPGNDRS